MMDLKKLGLFTVAAIILGALIGVSSATALVTGSFTATGGAGKLLETSKVTQQVFTITGSEIKCNKVTFSGSTEGTETTTQMVTPSYSECTAFGLPSEFINKGCTLTLTATTNASGHAEAHLESIPGQECSITILAKSIFGECHTELTPQTINGIHYVNNASPEDIKWQITASSITDHVTKSTGVCPLTVGTHTNARWTGEETVQASGGLQYMETGSVAAP